MDFTSSINLLRRDLHQAVGEVNKITALGRSGLYDESKLGLFKQTFSRLRPHFRSFMAKWDEILEFVLVNNCPSVFPNKFDEELKKAIKRTYYEVCAIYEDFVNPTPKISLAHTAPLAIGSGCNSSLLEKESPPIVSSPPFERRAHSPDDASRISPTGLISDECLNDTPSFCHKDKPFPEHNPNINPHRIPLCSENNFLSPNGLNSNASEAKYIESIPVLKRLGAPQLLDESSNTSLDASVANHLDSLQCLKRPAAPTLFCKSSDISLDASVAQHLDSLQCLKRPAAPTLFCKSSDIELDASVAHTFIDPNCSDGSAAPELPNLLGTTVEETVTPNDLTLRRTSRRSPVSHLNKIWFHEPPHPESKRPAAQEPPKSLDITPGRKFVFYGLQLKNAFKRSPVGHHFKSKWPHCSHVPRSKCPAALNLYNHREISSNNPLYYACQWRNSSKRTLVIHRLIQNWPHRSHEQKFERPAALDFQKSSGNLLKVAFSSNRPKPLFAFRRPSDCTFIGPNWLHQPCNKEIPRPIESGSQKSDGIPMENDCSHQDSQHRASIANSVYYRIPPVRYRTLQEALQVIRMLIYFFRVGGAELLTWRCICCFVFCYDLAGIRKMISLCLDECLLVCDSPYFANSHLETSFADAIFAN